MTILAVTQTDVLHALGWGGLGLLALAMIFALVIMLALMGVALGWARRQFAIADAALAPLGRTPVGTLLHDAVAGLQPKVDQVSDPYVQTVHGIVQGLVTGVANAVGPQYAERARKVITPEQVQRFLLYMVTGADELLDGEAGEAPDVSSPEVTAPPVETMPEGPNAATH